MLIVESGLEFLGTAVMPLVVHRCPDSEVLPEHLDAEATVATASKLIQSGDYYEGDAEHSHEEIDDLIFHFSLRFEIRV